MDNISKFKLGDRVRVVRSATHELGPSAFAESLMGKSDVFGITNIRYHTHLGKQIQILEIRNKQHKIAIWAEEADLLSENKPSWF